MVTAIPSLLLLLLAVWSPAVLSYENDALMSKVIEMVTVSSNDRRRLQTEDLFNNYCDLVEATGQFVCTCDDNSNIASCSSDAICDGDTCAVFSTDSDFDSNLQLVSIKICAEYLSEIDTPEFRDGCVTLMYKDNGDTVASCKIEFESFMDTLVPCDRCDVCSMSDGTQGYSIDCTNIEENASTNGCVKMKKDGGAFFPGFRVQSGASKITGLLVLGASLVLSMRL